MGCPCCLSLFRTVALYGKHIDIDTVAKLANISVDEVKALNRNITAPC
jgi:hypothetical protein